MRKHGGARRRSLALAASVTAGVVVVSLLLGALPAWATAVSPATVTLSNDDVSCLSDYTITFTVDKSVPLNGTITVGFPYGTTVAALVGGDVTVESTAGFGTANSPAVAVATANLALTAPVAATSTGPIVVITITAVDGFVAIGEGAQVRVTFLNTVVTNPPTIGDYTLTVKTSADTTATASQTYAIAGQGGPPPGGSAVSSATVTLSNAVISYLSDYSITFDVNLPVPKEPGWITVAFPLGTTVPGMGAWVVGDATVQSTAGFGLANPETNIAASDLITAPPTATDGPAVTIELAALANDIGEVATVRVKFLNTVVTNPATIGDYTLSVKTSADTTYTASQTYSLVAPTVAPLPGIVKVYNPSGILMNSFTGAGAIANGLAIAGANFTISVGEGTYVENPDTTADGQTIMAAGDAADTVVIGTWTIDQASVTVEGLTLKDTIPTNPAGAIVITGDKVTIRNCIIGKAGSAALGNVVAETLIHYNNLSGTDTEYGTITGCTFDTTLKNWSFISPAARYSSPRGPPA